MKSNKFRFALLLCCLFSIQPFSYVFAQWSYLGTWDKVQMTSNGKGFMISEGWNGSPTGGSFWRVEYTNDDWQTRTIRLSTSPGSYGCCSVEHFGVLDADNMLAIYNDMGYEYPQRSINGGYSFGSYGSAFTQEIGQVFPFSSTEYIVAGRMYVGNKLFITLIRNGQNIELTVPDTLRGTKCRVFKTDANVLFAAAADANGIVRLVSTADDGNTWSNTFSSSLSDYLEIDFPNDSVGYVGGKDGLCYRTADAGITWSDISLNTSMDVGGIDFLNADTGFVATKEGYMFTTFDGGQSWTSELVDSTAIFGQVEAFSLDAIYLRAVNYKLYKKGDLILSKEGILNATAQIQVLPNGQPHGYKIVLPESWTMQQWQLIDLRGSMLQEGSTDHLNLEGRPAGIYLMRVATNKGMQAFKIRKM
jgi:hypothetical protein